MSPLWCGVKSRNHCPWHMSSTMKAALHVLCTISAILSTASSLNCTFCRKFKNQDDDTYYRIIDLLEMSLHCRGESRSCNSEQVCASVNVFSLKYDGSAETLFSRGCKHPRDCNMSGSLSSLGFKTSFTITCCSTDNCVPAVPVLPVKNSTKNGVVCPACMTENQECDAMYSMECTGEEKYCMIHQRPHLSKQFHISTSGCASDVCRTNRSLDFLILSGSCAPLSENTDLTPGHSLWCPISFDYSLKDENDRTYLCSPLEDICIFEVIRNIHGKREQLKYRKRCGMSSECSRVGSIRSTNMTILVNTTCCDQDACIAPIPTLPPIRNDENGVICPACFVSNTDRCLHKTSLKCRGQEKRCIYYVKEDNQAILTVKEILYGCTTDEICEAGPRFFYEKGILYKTSITIITCNSATSWRGAAPRLLLLTLTTLSVLLMNYLSRNGM